jgi:hypothetical protein
LLRLQRHSPILTGMQQPWWRSIGHSTISFAMRTPRSSSPRRN